MVNIGDDKEVPKREAVSRYWAEQYNPYEPFHRGMGPLYVENWHDFVNLKVREQATKNREYLSKREGDIIDIIMRRGSIDLGNNCRIIKCPGTNKPAVCVLFSIQFQGEEHLTCSGPTVQKTKGGIIRAKKTYYEKERQQCDAYADDRFITNWHENKDFIAYVHQELHKHPEYTVVDAFEKWPYLEEHRDEILSH